MHPQVLEGILTATLLHYPPRIFHPTDANMPHIVFPDPLRYNDWSLRLKLRWPREQYVFSSSKPASRASWNILSGLQRFANLRYCHVQSVWRDNILRIDDSFHAHGDSKLHLDPNEGLHSDVDLHIFPRDGNPCPDNDSIHTVISCRYEWYYKWDFGKVQIPYE